jgi:solute carrier family 12 (potassium/chloride transporter), member 4/6
MNNEPSNPVKLGTFVGVFTPTVLTILGVIMFLRMGWVVSNAGLRGALLIVVIANTITLITALSMSTLATNMKVGVGGAYYIISRSLGLEVGGAIGIPLYLSQVLSVTLYAFGLAESVRIVWPGAPVQLLAAMVVIGVTAVAAKSTELTLKLQLPVMLLIAAAIASLAFGVQWGEMKVPMEGTYAHLYDAEQIAAFSELGREPPSGGFWMVFAVFFPAVTGVLAGVSLSGDLEDPSVAIPRGVIASVLVGFIVYLFVPVLLAHARGPAALADPLVWTTIAAVPWLVLPGLWGAILSSAFGSILGAPRTLQALAADRLAPHQFSKVDKVTGEPLLGLRLSGGIALAAVLLGDLNAVASWVTIFFLTTYGALNGVACLESLTSDTSFRPRIRVKWWVSFAGAAGCFLAMALIDPFACFSAIIVEIVIFYSLSARSLEATWGDVRSGLALTGARWALMNLRSLRYDARNWRPHILVFVEELGKSIELVKMADYFGQSRGIVTVSTLLQGDVEDHDKGKILAKNNDLIRGHGLESVFCEVTAVPDVDSGIVTVTQSNGIAGLSSNTVMLEYGDGGVAEMARLLRLSRKLSGLDKCTLIYRQAPTLVQRRRPKIIIWWKGRLHNGDLMLLLAHLLTVTSHWKGSLVVLKTVVDDPDEGERINTELVGMLEEIRMKVKVDIIRREDGENARDAIRRHSSDAALVFLGLPVPDVGNEEALAESVLALVEGMPPTLLVKNAGPFRGRLV